MLLIIKCFSKDSLHGENVYLTTTEMSSVNDVLKIAENNEGDWYECGEYPLLLVGQADYGMYPIIDEIQWFIFNKKVNKYIKIERPDKFYGYALLV